MVIGAARDYIQPSPVSSSRSIIQQGIVVDIPCITRRLTSPFFTKLFSKPVIAILPSFAPLANPSSTPSSFLLFSQAIPLASCSAPIVLLRRLRWCRSVLGLVYTVLATTHTLTACMCCYRPAFTSPAYSVLDTSYSL